jgi:hypothetical protein
MSDKKHIRAMKKARKQLKRTRDILTRVGLYDDKVKEIIDGLKQDIALAKIERDGEKADANGTPSAQPA